MENLGQKIAIFGKNKSLIKNRNFGRKNKFCVKSYNFAL